MNMICVVIYEQHLLKLLKNDKLGYGAKLILYIL